MIITKNKALFTTIIFMEFEEILKGFQPKQFDH